MADDLLAYLASASPGLPSPQLHADFGTPGQLPYGGATQLNQGLAQAAPGPSAAPPSAPGAQGSPQPTPQMMQQAQQQYLAQFPVAQNEEEQALYGAPSQLNLPMRPLISGPPPPGYEAWLGPLAEAAAQPNANSILLNVFRNTMARIRASGQA